MKRPTMAEEETAAEVAKRAGSRERSRRTHGLPPEDAIEQATREADSAALIRRMAGKPASDVLSRLSNGDPLKLYPLCARRIREAYFVLDPDRVFERLLALVAVGIEVEAEKCGERDWLLGRVDRAIQSILDHDREEERAGVPAENPEEHFSLFVEALYLEPPLARLASVRLNALEERVRKGFYLLMIEGRPLEEVLEQGLGPEERLHGDILLALQAVSLLDENGFEDLGKQEKKERKR